MIHKVLELVYKTTTALRSTVQDHLSDPHRRQSLGDAAAFVVHLHDALELTYGEHRQELMKPMRLALAGVLDASLFWLVSYPLFLDLVSSPMWKRHAQAISDDQFEYRRLLTKYPTRRGRITPSETLTNEPAPSITAESMFSFEEEAEKRE
jgi:hypothetical protein